MKANNTNGFTLIELLIVVAIIAILAAIAVPNFLEAQTRAKVSRVQSDMRTAATALEAYYVDNNDYPPGFGLTISDEDPWRFGLWVLSTPIAYLSNANLQDPMDTPFDPGNSDVFAAHPTASTIQYNSMYNSSELGQNGIILSQFVPFQVAGFGSISSVVSFGPSPGAKLEPGLRTSWWTLFSNGPDRDGGFGNGLTDAIIDSDNDLSVFPEHIYDPTNGTISAGNIWRAGGSGVNAAGRLINFGN